MKGEMEEGMRWSCRAEDWERYTQVRAQHNVHMCRARHLCACMYTGTPRHVETWRKHAQQEKPQAKTLLC